MNPVGVARILFYYPGASMAIIRPGARIPDKIPYMVEFNIMIETYQVPDTFPHMVEFNRAMVR